MKTLLISFIALRHSEGDAAEIKLKKSTLREPIPQFFASRISSSANSDFSFDPSNRNTCG